MQRNLLFLQASRPIPVSEALPVIAVTLHFRTPAVTLHCLDALLADGVTRILLVDNSEDRGRSLATMSDALDAMRGKGAQLAVLGGNKNLGFAGGVALAFDAMTSGEASHALLINSDAEMEPGAIADMLKALPPRGCVVPRILHGDKGAVGRAVHYYHRWLGLYLQSHRAGCVAYPSGSCILIHSSLVSPDFLDRDFFFYGEDVMLGHTLSRQNIPVGYCERAIVRHAVSLSARNGSFFYEYHMVRAHWLLARKLADNGVQFVLFLLGRMASLPLRAMVRVVRAGNLVPLWALWAASIDVLRGKIRDLTPPA